MQGGKEQNGKDSGNLKTIKNPNRIISAVMDLALKRNANQKGLLVTALVETRLEQKEA